MKRIRLLMAALAAMVGLSVNAQTWTGSDPAAGTFFLYNVGTKTFINVGDKSAGWGTNAYLTAEYGLDFTFEINEAAYNLNSRVTNGGNSHYLTTALWCDGAATPWTFTKVNRTDINAYTISNEGKYIVANAAGTDVEYTALSGTERDQWQIIGSTDILDNLNANTASGVNRTQATFFISDPDFGRNDQRRSNWSYTNSGGNVTVPGAGVNQGSAANYGCEFWNNTFDIHQSLSGLPNGIYEFEISGFGTNGTTYIYATTASGTTEKVFKNQTGAANFQTALNNIDNYSGNATGLVQVTDGTLIIGVKRETNSSSDWTVIDQARLYYYGNYTFADAYGADLKALIQTAQALVDDAPIDALAADLSTAITTAQDVVDHGQTEEDFATAKTNLQAVVDAYNTKFALTQRYFNIRTAALALATTLDVAELDANIVAATTEEGVNGIIANLRAAFLAKLPSVSVPADPGYIDVTSVMVDNASVSANVDYWTYNKTSGNGPTTNFGETEFYNANFKFYQTLALTPGTWEFGVTGFHRAGNHSTYFYAGEDKILIPGVESSVVNSMAAAKDYFDSGNGKVALKFLIEEAGNVEIGIDNQDTQTDKWTIFRDFTLKYYGAPDYSVYEERWNEAVTAAEDALTAYSEYDAFTATEKEALTTAKADVPTAAGKKAGYVEKTNTLADATSAYIAASQKFESAKTAIAKANAIKEAHNFVTAEAATTFAEAIKAISDKYDDATLTQEEAAAAGTTLGVVAVAWHNQRAEADRTAAEAYMKSVDFGINLNDWSVEGESDGSNFVVPFFEYWVSDANSLADATKTATLAGLPNGLYSVQALVRVRAKDGTAATDATGITMDVNGGGEGDYAAVDVTEGTQVGETQFSLGTFTAQGLVKQGALTLNFNVADANINWLSFKNIKYTKVRDLTEEEAYVAATAEDYEALNVAIADHVIGFEAGEYAPYNNIEAAATIAAAQAIDQTVENSQEDVQAATAAITGASWTVNETEVNAIYNGDFAIAAHDGASNPQPTGWYRNVGTYTGDGYNVRYVTIPSGVEGNTSEKGLFGKFTMMYGAEEGYTLPLKAGYYKLTFMYGGWNEVGEREIRLYNDDNNATVATSTVKAANNTGHNTASSWRAYSSIITVPAAGNYTLSFYRQNTSSQNQLVLTDIVLVKATAADFKGALLAEITTANAVDVTTNVGEGVFQIPAAAATALTTAISDAQTVYDNADATVDEVIVATESVETAVETYNNAELNAPNEEAIYNIVVATEGHAKAGNSIIVVPGTSGSNNPTGYALNANLAANKNLSQAFKFTKVSGNLYLISAQLGEGRVYMTNGTLNGSAAGWKDSQIQFTTDEEKAMQFKIEAVANVVAFKIYNTETNTTVDCQNGGNIYTEGNNTLFTVTETTRPVITISTTEAGYGTLMLPFFVATLPEGVKAYTCAAVDGEMLTLTEVDALEANKPYIIEGAWETLLSGDAQGTALTYTDGLLTGVYEEQLAPVDSYVLQMNDEKVGFYRVVADQEPTMGANRAYLTVPAAGAREAYFFGEAGTTGISTIDAVKALTGGNARIFNAAGVEQSGLQKGLNIVKKADGTSFKVMVK